MWVALFVEQHSLGLPNSSVGATPDLGGQLAEPSVSVEEEVEVEQVVGGERQAGAGLTELGRQPPDLHANT